MILVAAAAVGLAFWAWRARTEFRPPRWDPGELVSIDPPPAARYANP